MMKAVLNTRWCATLMCIVVSTFCLHHSYAQARHSKKQPPAKVVESTRLSDTDDHHDGLNQVDQHNLKQGTWFTNHKALRGEPAFMEFGNYSDNQKSGLWYKLDDNGQLMAIQNYRKGVLDGQSQFYENGKLVCIGTYRGLNPDTKYDSIWVTDPGTQLDSLVVVPSERGSLKHGLWRYYDPLTGQLTMEEEYQVDDLLYRKRFEVVSTQTDSLYIRNIQKNMPHNKYPNGIKSKHKQHKYIY